MKNISSSDQISILACQIETPKTRSVSERDQNLVVLRDKVVNSLADKRVDVVVLPELCSIEYSIHSFRRLDALAETLDGPSFNTWRSISREFNTYVVYSFPRKSADSYQITLAVMGPDGYLVGYYDKIFLAQYGDSMERDYYQAGDKLFVFEVNNIKLGVIICADIRIPEFARSLTLSHGADVILHPSTFTRDTSFYSWHHFVVTRALENQIYLLSLNRAGKNCGNSIFCPPWVDEERLPLVFDDCKEQFLKLNVDRSEIELVRENFSFLKYRFNNHNIQQVLLKHPNQDNLFVNYG